MEGRKNLRTAIKRDFYPNRVKKKKVKFKILKFWLKTSPKPLPISMIKNNLSLAVMRLIVSENQIQNVILRYCGTISITFTALPDLLCEYWSINQKIKHSGDAEHPKFDLLEPPIPAEVDPLPLLWLMSDF